MILWTDQTAENATRGKATGAWQASRVVIDSRAVVPGDLFVALAGDKFDGHDYVKDALAKGAVAVVVSRDMGTAQLLVKDTQEALEALGREARKRSKAKIVGVTGSVGKTSTREMIRLALAAHGRTYATDGNLNNHIGTPLTLANLPPDAQFAVLEMGMNHAGEIAALTRQVRPHVAVITNIEAVHLEFFSSLEAIADAKAEIFEGLEPDGVAVLNADNAYFARLASRAGTVIACGKAAGADVRLVDYKASAVGCALGAMLHGKKVAIALGAIGKHWAMTALFALAVGDALGLDADKTARALAGFSELAGRGRVSMIAGGVVLVDDSYNASPASMRAAFAKVAELWEARGKKGRKIAALGDMLELGASSNALHAGLAADLQAQGFDAVFVAGKAMGRLFEALPEGMRGTQVEKAPELLTALGREIKKDDILLIKGSHGSHMYEVAKALLESGKEKHAV